MAAFVNSEENIMVTKIVKRRSYHVTVTEKHAHECITVTEHPRPSSPKGKAKGFSPPHTMEFCFPMGFSSGFQPEQEVGGEPLGTELERLISHDQVN